MEIKPNTPIKNIIRKASISVVKVGKIENYHIFITGETMSHAFKFDELDKINEFLISEKIYWFDICYDHSALFFPEGKKLYDYIMSQFYLSISSEVNDTFSAYVNHFNINL